MGKAAFDRFPLAPGTVACSVAHAPVRSSSSARAYLGHHVPNALPLPPHPRPLPLPPKPCAGIAPGYSSANKLFSEAALRMAVVVRVVQAIWGVDLTPAPASAATSTKMAAVCSLHEAAVGPGLSAPAAVHVGVRGRRPPHPTPPHRPLRGPAGGAASRRVDAAHTAHGPTGGVHCGAVGARQPARAPPGAAHAARLDVGERGRHGQHVGCPGSGASRYAVFCMLVLGLRFPTPPHTATFSHTPQLPRH